MKGGEWWQGPRHFPGSSQIGPSSVAINPYQDQTRVATSAQATLSDTDGQDARYG